MNTPTQAPGILTPNTDPARYRQEGYCFFPDVLSADEIEIIRAQLDRQIAALPAKRIVHKDGVPQEVDARPEYMTEPHTRDAFWLELCRHPKILDCVETLLGPDLVLIMSHLIVKRAEDGLPVSWHQDNTYWPSVQGSEIGTVWMAIDDTDRANGCMQVIPCTHAGYPEMEKIKTDGRDLLGLTVEVTEEMRAGAVALEMKAGSLSIHDSFVLHGSEPNLSGRRRAAYTMRYANPHKVKVDAGQHWVPVYLVRGGGGTEAAQFADIRPGKPLPEASAQSEPDAG
ncbi:MAG: phytanoyl-CoA dioxygenase family protein [Verrucomicrobiota bacterium]|nr:phytanoyl-CoA dioxygenase family protein [Verrucomicrobiota bacterium]